MAERTSSLQLRTKDVEFSDPIQRIQHEELEEKTPFSSLKEMPDIEKEKFPHGILVAGKTGTGKSALVNLIFNEDIAQEGDSKQSETKDVTKYGGKVRGSYVDVYDSPGLEDTEMPNDDLHLETVENIIKQEQIDLTVFCIPMTATRLERSLIRTFQEYNKIGLNWENVIIALTFAGKCHIPRKLKVITPQYFRDQVKMWKRDIQSCLRDRVGLSKEAVEKISESVYPVMGGYDERLPTGEDWFTLLWHGILKALPERSLYPFLAVHENYVIDPKLKDIAEQKLREQQGDHLHPPQLGDQPSQGSHPPQEDHGHPPRGDQPPQGSCPQQGDRQPRDQPPQGGRPQQGDRPPQGNHPPQGNRPPQRDHQEEGNNQQQGDQEGGIFRPVIKLAEYFWNILERKFTHLQSLDIFKKFAKWILSQYLIPLAP